MGAMCAPGTATLAEMDLSGRAADRHATTRLGVVSALLDGDAALAFHQVLAAMSDGTPFDEILFDILASIQVDVGRRWVAGDYGVADEHAISAGVETVVALLAGSFDQPADGALVVVASAEGDTHSLPARVLAAYLVYREFRVANLGATLPAEDLEEFLRVHEPSALVLTCTMASNLPGARKCIAAAHRAGVPVVAGGRGFGETQHRARALGADAWLSNPRLLDGLLERWEPNIEEAEARAPDPAEAPIAQRWPDIAAVAESAAASVESGGGAAVVIRRDVEMFTETLDAALLVDEAGPLVDLAVWHASFIDSGNRPKTTRPILEALVHRIGVLDERIGEFVSQAVAAL